VKDHFKKQKILFEKQNESIQKNAGREVQHDDDIIQMDFVQNDDDQEDQELTNFEKMIMDEF
jgi:methyl-accepting chemotaxis protein